MSQNRVIFKRLFPFCESNFIKPKTCIPYMNTHGFKTATKILLATIILFTFVSGLTQVLAYDLEQMVMCYNYSYSSLKPKGEATAFFTHQEYVAMSLIPQMRSDSTGTIHPELGINQLQLNLFN